MTQIDVDDLVGDRDWPAVRQLYAECGWRDPNTLVHSSVRGIIARDTTREVLVGVVCRVERPPLAAEWHDKYGAASRVALFDLAVVPASRRHGVLTVVSDADGRMA